MNKQKIWAKSDNPFKSYEFLILNNITIPAANGCVRSASQWAMGSPFAKKWSFSNRRSISLFWNLRKFLVRKKTNSLDWIFQKKVMAVHSWGNQQKMFSWSRSGYWKAKNYKKSRTNLHIRFSNDFFLIFSSLIPVLLCIWISNDAFAPLEIWIPRSSDTNLD